ncbi:hypothetical protein EV368DRAFT_81032 [Lentinula lateritia]|uniref:Uncharacterized protein n=1 Tax=Lentinula aff. lateritia TaxID=2804960 RepID=A0ACC1UBX2_9AGAR|nr:hypothetical protein F5876DRAFT_73310 [Lentinula aff. lateritia]KAJ3853987.1 hypothetical protein EV368DRAFT_81032 [Lentinula lateritia]
MGRSAKVHKRVAKKIKTSSNTPSQYPTQTEQQLQLQASRKKATLKEKTKQAAKSTNTPQPVRKEGEHVLGGVDYVSLLMGGRKKAREEGGKLSRGD